MFFKVLILVGILTHNVYSESRCVDESFYPHENECGKYYQCANGKLEAFDCPANLEFNLRLSMCVSPTDSECISVKPDCGDDPCQPVTTTTCTPPTTTTCTPPTTTTCTPPTTTTCTPPTTTTCTPPTTTTCTPPTTTTCTPPTTTTCTPPTTTTCTPPTTTCKPSPPCTDPPEVILRQPYPECPSGVADPNTDVLLPLPSCCQFVHCTNFGVGVVKNCAPSDPPLVFSPCEQRCVWPHEVGNLTCTPCKC